MTKGTRLLTVSFLLLLLSFSMAVAQETTDDMSNGISNEVEISQTETGEFPEAFDWRDKDGQNWMTPVKEQGLCGGCWAFATIGVVEATVKIHADDPTIDVDLSEQYLISDCCSAGNCYGGWPNLALRHIREIGTPDENCFPYAMSNSACTPCLEWEEDPIKIEDYVRISSSKDALKAALQKYGPLVVLVNTPDDWYYGSIGGTYESIGGSANQAVILVGWDDFKDCWIVKNSWGTGWGEDGYGRVRYGDIERHDYAYAVTGIADNNPVPNQPPMVDIIANPMGTKVPLYVLFESWAMDPDGTIASYEWAFGDGAGSTEPDPYYIYTIPGMYTATLTVTDDDGATGSASVTIVAMSNLPPFAKVSANPESGTAPFEVAFTGSGEDVDGTIVSYEWAFGDGASSTSQNPTHVYAIPDIYTATLTVTDDDGATGSASVMIMAMEPEPEPEPEPVIWSWIRPDSVEASSSFNKNRAPEKAIDGEKKTYWCPSTSDILPYLQFDLGSEEQISKVRVMTSHQRRSVPVIVDIRVSDDGVNWDTVVSEVTVTERNVFVEISFTQANARYVRLCENSLSDRLIQCAEFEAYIGRT